MISIVLLCVIVLIVIVYHKLKYYKLYGPIPGLEPEFLKGNLRQSGILKGKPASIVFVEWQEKYGDVYQFFFGPTRFIILANMKDIEHVFNHRHLYDQAELRLKKDRLFFGDALICNKGEKYKRHAALTLPLFRRAKLISNLEIINDCTDKLLDQWRSKSEEPNYLHEDIPRQCQNLLFAIFGYVAFDYDLHTLDDGADKEGTRLTQALRTFLDTYVKAFRVPMFVVQLYLMFSPHYRQALSTIHNHLNEIIDAELSKTQQEIAERKRTSLIASLINSIETTDQNNFEMNKTDRKGLTRQEVFDEMLLFLVAGYETTSTATLWFIHLMSKNPRVQAKIKAELDDHRHDPLSIEQLDSLNYLDCVMREVLRFVPPASGSARTLNLDDKLPGSGVQLYKGDQVLIPSYILSHDKRYWKIDPDLFYPERFLGEDKDHGLYASMPFGGGHRQCVGQELAKLELKAIAARLMQKVTFIDGGSEANAGEYEQKLTIMPKHFRVYVKFDSF